MVSIRDGVARHAKVQASSVQPCLVSTASLPGLPVVASATVPCMATTPCNVLVLQLHTYLALHLKLNILEVTAQAQKQTAPNAMTQTPHVHVHVLRESAL